MICGLGRMLVPLLLHIGWIEPDVAQQTVADPFDMRDFWARRARRRGAQVSQYRCDFRTKLLDTPERGILYMSHYIGPF